MRFLPELYLAKFLAFAADKIDKNRGTSFAGRHILKLDKDFVSRFKNIDGDRVILVTGTNGKSSTTNLLHHIFTACGEKVISNLAGANLASGIATCFVKNSNLKGELNDGYVILEVDERTLKYVLNWIPARHLVVTNIMTDQVGRNGCPEFIYNMLADHIQGRGMTLYLNNDEPRSKAFEELGARCVYYSCEKMETAFRRDGEMDISVPCPKCHAKIAFDYNNVCNMGPFHCTRCGHASEPQADYTVTDIDFANRSASILGRRFTLPYDTPFMMYNYAAAVAVAREMGLDEDKIIASFDRFKNIEGRIEAIDWKDKTIRYMRTKQENPETCQSALDAIARDAGKKVVAIGLCTVDDWIPYYSNTFYSFDCDFKPLMTDDVEKFIVFDKTVCYDVANRLIYDGCPEDKITIVPNSDPKAILAAIGECESHSVYLITLLKVFHDIQGEAAREEE